MYLIEIVSEGYVAQEKITPFKSEATRFPEERAFRLLDSLREVKTIRARLIKCS